MTDGPIKSVVEGGMAAEAGTIIGYYTKNAMGYTGTKATYGSDIGSTVLGIAAGVGVVVAAPEALPVAAIMFGANYLGSVIGEEIGDGYDNPSPPAPAEPGNTPRKNSVATQAMPQIGTFLGPAWGHCFPGDTPILMGDGSKKIYLTSKLEMSFLALIYWRDWFQLQ